MRDLTHSPSEGVVVAVDVGATKTVAALVVDDVITDIQRHDTPAGGGDAVVRAVTALIGQLINDPVRTPLGIGIAVAGQIDPHQGAVTGAGSSIPEWSGTELAEPLVQRFGIPAVIENDCNAFAAGIGLENESLLGVMVGTGLGSGLLLDGSLRHGARFTGGEIGHLAAPEAGPWCSCGRSGHLEGMASGIGMEQHYAEVACTSIPMQEIVMRAAAGEDHAREVIRAGAAGLGAGLAGLAVMLDLDRIALGGGIVDNAPDFAERCTTAFLNAQPEPLVRTTTLEVVREAWRVVLVGAARRLHQQQAPDYRWSLR